MTLTPRRRNPGRAGRPRAGPGEGRVPAHSVEGAARRSLERLKRGHHVYNVCKWATGGLAHVHSCRFAHLDLRPAIIPLDRFGCAKTRASASRSASQRVVLTHSPEHARSRRRSSRWVQSTIRSKGIPLVSRRHAVLHGGRARTMAYCDARSGEHRMAIEPGGPVPRDRDGHAEPRPRGAEEVAAAPFFRQRGAQLIKQGASMIPDPTPQGEMSRGLVSPAGGARIVRPPHAARTLGMVSRRPMARRHPISPGPSQVTLGSED